MIIAKELQGEGQVISTPLKHGNLMLGSEWNCSRILSGFWCQPPAEPVFQSDMLNKYVREKQGN
jgi:hypothetical protein